MLRISALHVRTSLNSRVSKLDSVSLIFRGSSSAPPPTKDLGVPSQEPVSSFQVLSDNDMTSHASLRVNHPESSSFREVWNRRAKEQLLSQCEDQEGYPQEQDDREQVFR